MNWNPHPFNDTPRGMGAYLEPFGRATRITKTTVEINAMARETGVPVRDILQAFAAEAKLPIFQNDLYQVSVRPVEAPGAMLHLSIKRIDKEPIHDWRHLQEIKNRIVGPDVEAVEIYPAVARLVDSANQYHLWCFMERGFRLPFGFNQRFEHYGLTDATGAKQRPLPE